MHYGQYEMLNNELPTTIVLHDFESTKDSTNERQIKQRLTISADLKSRLDNLLTLVTQ